MRWGALVFGVFYGFSHQTSISSQAKATAAQHDYDRKAKLIDQARAEFKRQTQPQDSKVQGGGELAFFSCTVPPSVAIGGKEEAL